MTLAELIPLAIRASIFGTVLALGLRATIADATWVLRKPKVLLRGLVAMYVIMPIVAAGLVLSLDLAPAVDVALIALALSPVPPVLPKKELKAGAEVDRSIGLLVAAALLSVVVIPVGLEVASRVFPADASLSSATVWGLVLSTVLAPLAIGVVARLFLRGLADRIADPLMKVSTILLLLGVLPILVMMGPAMGSLIGGGTLAALAAFVVVGLLVGHLLGGSRAGDRTVLALSTATRHPGVALAIASGVTPQEGAVMPPVAPAVLLYLLVGAVLSGVYLALRRRKTVDTPAAPG
jgi:BASS family bile acid:Na+ symporter